jgi:inactivated superfamily I helicase
VSRRSRRVVFLVLVAYGVFAGLWASSQAVTLLTSSAGPTPAELFDLVIRLVTPAVLIGLAWSAFRPSLDR